MTGIGDFVLSLGAQLLISLPSFGEIPHCLQHMGDIIPLSSILEAEVLDLDSADPLPATSSQFDQSDVFTLQCWIYSCENSWINSKQLHLCPQATVVIPWVGCPYLKKNVRILAFWPLLDFQGSNQTLQALYSLESLWLTSKKFLKTFRIIFCFL